jgi:hypothetical protein
MQVANNGTEKPDYCKQLGQGFLVTSFDKTSMSNIDAEDGLTRGSEQTLLWAHLVALYLVVFICLKVRLLSCIRLVS